MILRNAFGVGVVIVCMQATACDDGANSVANVASGPAVVQPARYVDDENDVRITAEIRKSILEDEAMSVHAQSCKISTVNGVVTLRGVVENEAEKDSVAAKAAAVQGVVRVENQLDVIKVA